MLTPRECGHRCRVALGEILKSKYGSYRIVGRKLVFKNATIFAIYSDFHQKISQWFFDVPEIEWQDWRNNFLAIAMKESNESYYILLDFHEAVTLLDKCGKDHNGNKKINIRRPSDGGKIYFVEWNEFSLSHKVHFLKVSLE